MFRESAYLCHGLPSLVLWLKASDKAPVAIGLAGVELAHAKANPFTYTLEAVRPL